MVRKNKQMTASSGDVGYKMRPIWSYGENVLNPRKLSVLPQKKKSAFLLCIVTIICMHTYSDNLKAID